MAFRIGIDLDGTLADLSATYHECEEALFGERSGDVEADEAAHHPSGDDAQALQAARDAVNRRDRIWTTLRATPNLWTRLRPIEPGVIARLHAAARAHHWEVFFLTQRPTTAGDAVQEQTQQWLVAQGFALPSVLTLAGERGRAAAALDLDFLIDDLPKNCVDCVSNSRCQPILVLRGADVIATATARRLKIGTVRSVAEAIALLEQARDVERTSAVTRVMRRLGLA